MRTLFKQITTFLHLNKKVGKYFVFLFVSFVFWFLTVMSKQYQTTLTIPIKYVDLPESKQLINEPAKTIQLTVKSPGFSLLSKNLFKKTKPLNIVVNSLSERMKKGYNQKYWVSNKNPHQLYTLLSSDIKIMSVFPDTVFLHFQKKHSKKVPIVFLGNLNFSPQYRLKDKIQISPDSILIFGAKEKLTHISDVKTNYVEFQDLETATSRRVNLTKIEGVSFSQPKNLQVSLAVEKFTEKIVELSLNAVNVPPGYKIKFYPPKVSVVTTVAFSDYDKLNSSLFIAEVDAYKTAGKNKLQVILSKQPTFADIAKIKPNRVEFLLIKN